MIGGNGSGSLGAWIVLQPDSKSLSAAQTPQAGIPVTVADVREAAGITFKQDGMGTKEKYYLGAMGTDVGWIDYDQDGPLDLYLVQSAATKVYPPPHPLRSALYHNNGDGTLDDVTCQSGIGNSPSF